VGDTGGTSTDDNGEFVLFFDDVSGLGQAATIRATSAAHPAPVDVPVRLVRGATVAVSIVLN
jgi:hypothetical protein